MTQATRNKVAGRATVILLSQRQPCLHQTVASYRSSMARIAAAAADVEIGRRSRQRITNLRQVCTSAASGPLAVEIALRRSRRTASRSSACQRARRGAGDRAPESRRTADRRRSALRCSRPLSVSSAGLELSEHRLRGRDAAQARVVARPGVAALRRSVSSARLRVADAQQRVDQHRIDRRRCRRQWSTSATRRSRRCRGRRRRARRRDRTPRRESPTRLFSDNWNHAAGLRRTASSAAAPARG